MINFSKIYFKKSEEIGLKIKKYIALVGALTAVLTFAGCGSDPEIAEFKNDLNVFCENVGNFPVCIF